MLFELRHYLRDVLVSYTQFTTQQTDVSLCTHIGSSVTIYQQVINSSVKLTKSNQPPIGHSAPKKGRRFILSCCLVKFERV